MSARIKELQTRRLTSIQAARSIVDKAETEKRNLTTEEQTAWDNHHADALRDGKSIETLQRQAAAEQELAGTNGRGLDTGTEPNRRGGDAGQLTPAQRANQLFGQYLRGGVQALGANGVQEFRTLTAGHDTEGGFLVAPQEWVAQLLKNVDDQVFMRQLATKYTVTQSESLGVPTLDTDFDDADWTTELATGSDDDLGFGKRELRPHPLAKRVKVSNKLMRVSSVPVENLVRERLAYKFGVTEEKAFLLGTGASQPLGVFVASTDGIPTSRDVSTGNTTTAVTFDGLIEAKYSLKGQYWGNARWLFHRDVMKMIAKIKDSAGQYIWEPSKRAGDPDLVLGKPFIMSEHAPNTFTTGLYVGMLADFKHYWIADALNLQIQRLTELYAETNRVGFIGRHEVDGAPAVAEAFVRVKLA